MEQVAFQSAPRSSEPAGLADEQDAATLEFRRVLKEMW